MITINPELKKIIETSYIALATCDKLMKPNLIIVNGVHVVGPNQILVTDKCMVKTRVNLLVNGQLSLAVWQGDQAFQLKGNAQYITSGSWKKIVDAYPENKKQVHKAAVLVNITEIWDLHNCKLLLSDNY